MKRFFGAAMALCLLVSDTSMLSAAATTWSRKASVFKPRLKHSAYVPPPSPTPTPTPTPGATPTPTPAATDAQPGIIATTDFAIADGTLPGWTQPYPPTNAPDNVGALRFICGPGPQTYDDAVVYPGVPGASHLHQTFGGYMDSNTTYTNARASGGSTCNDIAGQDNDHSKITRSLNRTPYWVPAMLDGHGNVIVPDYIGVYYKREPVTSVECLDKNRYPGGCQPVPRGLKQVFGNKPSDSSYVNPDSPPQYLCSDTGGGDVTDFGMDLSGALTCAHDKAVSTGQPHNLIARLQTGTCWNGTTIDSADHRSHLAYTYNTGHGYFACDAQHPVHIPFFLEAETFTILASDDVSLWHFSSDEMDNSKPRGWSYHGDYGPMAWDPATIATWEANCINLLRSCAGGELGDGTQLKGAAIPYYYANGTYTSSFTNPNRIVAVPVHP